MIGTRHRPARGSAPVPCRAAATIVLLGLCLGAFAAPAAAEEPHHGRGVEIEVVIAPRADCVDVRPPCRCDAGGAPTLPPGLVKKVRPTSTEKGTRDWCAPANPLAAELAEPTPWQRVPRN